VEIARQVGADALAHGCTGKGNDQVRFELTYMAFAPELPVIAPWREWDIRSREDAIAYAAERGVPVAATLTKIYSRDRNIWHLSHEGGRLENPALAPEADMFQLTADAQQAPDAPEDVTITFTKGTPVAVDGQRLGPVALLTRLNELGAKHGVGRIDLVEDRLIGMKSRGVYETPGGTLLYSAHSELEQLVLDRRTLAAKDLIAPALRGPRVRGPLVDDRARGVRRVRERHAGARHRHGHDAALQGLGERRRPRERARAVRRALRHLRRGRRLPAERRGGLHPPLRARRSACARSRTRDGAQAAGGRRATAARRAGVTRRSRRHPAGRRRRAGGRRVKPRSWEGRHRRAIARRAERDPHGAAGSTSCGAAASPAARRPILEAINRSIGVDFRLWPHDVRLSKAWAVALWNAGVLTLEESRELERGLDVVGERLAGGEQPTRPTRTSTR
jgi:hypothetical protein